MDLIKPKNIQKKFQTLNPFTKLATGVQKVAEKASDVRDLVDTSREDAVDYNKKLISTLPEVKKLYKKLKAALDNGKEKYDKSLEISIYMFARYFTYKDASKDISDCYEHIQTFIKDFPVAVEGEKLSEFAMEIVDCFEKAEHRKEMEKRKSFDPSEWKEQQETANNAITLTENCKELAEMEEKYAEMSTCEIIRSNKELQAEIALYGERCSELWRISAQLSRDFVSSKELPPTSRYSRLREMLRKAVNNKIYLNMCNSKDF